MKLNFNTEKAYNVAKTLLGGNDYKFTYYIDELSIRFYTHGSYVSGLSALSEIGISVESDFAVDCYEYHLPALEPGWSTIG